MFVRQFFIMHFVLFSNRASEHRPLEEFWVQLLATACCLEFCMFSPRLRGFLPSTLVSSHSQHTYVLGWLCVVSLRHHPGVLSCVFVFVSVSISDFLSFYICSSNDCFHWIILPLVVIRSYCHCRTIESKYTSHLWYLSSLCRTPLTASRSIFWTSVASAWTFSGCSTINSGSCEYLHCHCCFLCVLSLTTTHYVLCKLLWKSNQTMNYWLLLKK